MTKGRTTRKTPKTHPERPDRCKGARALDTFIAARNLSVRGAAEELGISHVFLLDILKGLKRPRDVTVDKIATWTDGNISREMWRFQDEIAAIAAQRSHRAAS